MVTTTLCKTVNQYLRQNLDEFRLLQVIGRNQFYFSSSNVSTDTKVIIKD